MSQKAWTQAQADFRRKLAFPRNWRRLREYVIRMESFNEGFLQGYNASNVMWSKKKDKS